MESSSHSTSAPVIRIALLDLYEGVPNEGMRCLRSLIQEWGQAQECFVELHEFEVRQQEQLPDTSYDVYISSGGPGSPLESAGSSWENKYFDWIKNIDSYNRSGKGTPKHILFICHSFQLACRYFGIGEVCPRKSTAFGIFPIHLLEEGHHEPVFEGLKDPFYSVDSRDFQVIQPNHARLRELGAHILAIEKNRPHVPYERAMMAVRFNPYFIGTQFHPEADAEGMQMYLQRADKKATIIENHGEAKWTSMVEHLQDPDKILWTYTHVLPNFLNHATEAVPAISL
ncbi:MAG: GMP synthase [Chitinophagaceae bacterium]|nr:GMP synthase [Chitinophagaceae bacterium]